MGAAKHAFFSGLRMELAGFCPSSQIAFKEAWIQVLILPYLVCLVCGCAKERDISNEFLTENHTKPVSTRNNERLPAGSWPHCHT